MIRDSFAAKGPRPSERIRWRGTEVSRVEGFSDAVFAFAMTLLVVSLEVPKTFGELRETLRAFPVFAICFASLLHVWHAHYLFFRRYGLEDGWTRFLNGVLLFVVLFYVYPLKFIFTIAVAATFGGDGRVPGRDGLLHAPLASADATALYTIYGLGVVAVFGLLALFHLRALRLAAALDLDERERFETRASIGAHLCMVGGGLFSVGLALAFGTRAGPWPGFSYFLIGPARFVLEWVVGTRRERRFRRGRADAAPPSATASV